MRLAAIEFKADSVVLLAPPFFVHRGNFPQKVRTRPSSMSENQPRNKNEAISNARRIMVVAFLKRILVDAVLARALKASQ